MDKSPNANEIRRQRFGVGRLTVEKAAKIVDVSARTWRRWESGTGKMPPAAWKWFRTVTDGIPYAQNWEGWGFKDGKLWSPEQDSFSPGEIRSLTILQQLSRGKTGSHHFKPSDLLLGVDERVADHLKLIGKLDLVGLMLALIYSDNLKIPESEEREQVEEGLRKLIAGVQRVQHQQAMVTA